MQTNIELLKNLTLMKVNTSELVKEIEYLRTVPIHPRTRLQRSLKLFNRDLNLIKTIWNLVINIISDEDDVQVTKIIAPTDKLTTTNDVAFIKQPPGNLKVKVDDKPVFVKQTPSYPRDRLQKLFLRQIKITADEVAKRIKNDGRLRKALKKRKHPKVYLATEVIKELLILTLLLK